MPRVICGHDGELLRRRSVANLAWLSARQRQLEKALFARQAVARRRNCFSTMSPVAYLEGEHNAVGADGYNRDQNV